MFCCCSAGLFSFRVRQEGAAQTACKRNCGSKYQRGCSVKNKKLNVKSLYVV